MSEMGRLLSDHRRNVIMGAQPSGIAVRNRLVFDRHNQRMPAATPAHGRTEYLVEPSLGVRTAFDEMSDANGAQIVERMDIKGSR
jgi:hypothetical protein